MSEQRHSIKRQIIELQVPSAAAARQLQADVSRIYRQRLMPLIDQLCNEFSEPDRLHRIELLEVDLGRIDPTRLEEELVAKTSVVLRKVLAEQIRKQERVASRTAQTTSQLELFACFARTGTLPWWVDTTQPQLLAQNLEHLIQFVAEPLRRLLRELAQEQRPLQRIVYQYEDEQLAALAEFLAPHLRQSLRHELPRLIALLQQSVAAAGRSSAQVRQIIWYHLLTVASLGGQTPTRPESFAQAVLRRVATEVGLSLPVLRAQLQQFSQSGSESVGSLFAQPLVMAKEEISSPMSVIAPLLMEPTQPTDETTDLWRVLQTFTPHFPALLQAQWQTTLSDLEQAWSSQSPALPALIRQVLQLFQRGLTKPLSPSWIEDWLPELQPLALAAGLSLAELSVLVGIDPLRLDPQRRPTSAMDEPEQASGTSGRPIQSELSCDNSAPVLPTAVDETSTDFRRNDAPATKPFPAAVNLAVLGATAITEMPLALPLSDDEVYIGNAGLVLLWPFLGSFFARLGLLKDKTFKDDAAVQRAVGLLHYAATGEPVFPEYLLPLNKVLCGLALTSIFDFGPPLTEAEAEECTDLLRAVIVQAPILRDMSVDGLRGTFLLRQGVLRTRDGVWLLQVERQTYDLVLGRFPWSWEWVSLPWMAAALRVEW